MQVQYSSDLHINTFPAGTPFETFVRPVAPILVLAGDIGNVSNPLYAQCLAWCSQRWSTVILIAGNHEYFCEPNTMQTMDEIDQTIRRICMQLRIHFLQAGQSVKVPGTNLRFVGATLWSDIDTGIWSEVQATKGEFRNTFQQTPSPLVRATYPSDINALHALHKAQLSSAIAPHSETERLIVVTHHMPTFSLLDAEHATHRFRSCYASKDDDLFAPNIVAWICGHGHRATQQTVPNGPLLCMNARGYPSQVLRIRDRYNPEASLFVKN
jgi:UDP-2,3-diacylglucosamine pyrophosphatase LpxH